MNFILLIGAVTGINILIFIVLLTAKWINEGKLNEFIYNHRRNRLVRFGKLRARHYFIGAVYLAVLIVALYLVVGNLNPSAVPGSSGTYIISADDSFLTNSLSSFYINPSSVLGEKQAIDDKTVRAITSQQSFNLVFKPKTIIDENATGTLEINFLSNGEGSEVYFNNELIIPNTDNYAKVAGYNANENTEVYVKKTLLNYYEDNFSEESDAGSFIYENFPGSSVYSQVVLPQITPQLTDYMPETTKIKETFRGDLKLAVYAENDLDISFAKQDLNGYLGEDEYSVIITDLNGKAYFNQIYSDDGDRKNTNKLRNEQDFSIKLDNLPRGIYFITFTKDKNNDAADSTLKNIKISSNKILIVGNILPWQVNTQFYTKSNGDDIIGFYYWWTGKDQIIKITGVENTDINLNQSWFSKRYNANLTQQGDYYIKIDKGYLWVYADYLSINKDTWFDMPVITANTNTIKFTNQDIIILNSDKVSINGNKYTYKTNISASDLKNLKIKVIDPNKIYLKNIKFSI